MKLYIFAPALLCMALAAGCDRNDNDMERLGERTEDAFEKAGDRTEEAMDETGDAIENTAEDVTRERKDGSG